MRPSTHRTLIRPGAETTRDPTLLWRLPVALGMNIPTIMFWGDHQPMAPRAALYVTQLTFLVAYICLLLIAHRRAPDKSTEATTPLRRLLRPLNVSAPEQIFAACGLLLAFSPRALAAVGIALTLIFVLRGFLSVVQRSLIPSGMVFVGSFIAFIAVGSGLLMLPSATPPDQPITVTDAVFTITSAISQTGLVVRPTGGGFTRFGQIVILIWIQVGALGVIVFGALLATVLGSSFGLKATQTLAEGTEQGWSGQLSLQKLVIFTMVVTHLAEIIGALLFYFGWPDTWPGQPADFATSSDRMFHAIFFSVSAFCNAGFATTENSLQGLRTHWTSHGVVITLIVLGSIGFPVLQNIWRVIVARVKGKRTDPDGRLVRLNLNSRIILATWITLYVFGFGMIFVGETTQADQPLGVAIFDAHFMNLNRTSGFDTIAPADMGALSQLVLIFLMFCGGAPGSVAGGIKLMVFAILALTVWSTIRGRLQTQAFNRTLPEALIRKSATLIVLLLGLVMACAAVLAYCEDTEVISLEEIIFEVTSAVGTTGLSLGITPDLSTPSRWALIVAMFLGRVGTFAVVAALVSITRRRRAQYTYPVEDVTVY